MSEQEWDRAGRIAEYIDSLPLNRRRAGMGAFVQLLVYADGEADITAMRFANKEEMLTAMGRLYDRSQEAARLADEAEN